MKQAMIVAGNMTSALQVAKRHGLRGPKVVTKMEHFYEYSGEMADIGSYRVYVAYDGIDRRILNRLQRLTKKANR